MDLLLNVQMYSRGGYDFVRMALREETTDGSGPTEAETALSGVVKIGRADQEKHRDTSLFQRWRVSYQWDIVNQRVRVLAVQCCLERMPTSSMAVACTN
mgnify:CR=1 FL=1